MVNKLLLSILVAFTLVGVVGFAAALGIFNVSASISYPSSATVYNHDITHFDWTANSDNGDNMNHCTYSVDGIAQPNIDACKGVTSASGTETLATPLGDGMHNITFGVKAKSANNEVFIEFTVDKTPPTIDSVSDIVAEATSSFGANVAFSAPMSHDAIDGDLVSTCDSDSGDLFPFGPTTVTCSKTDAAGNVATPSVFTITVQDTTAPTVTVPSDIEVEATSQDGAVATFSVTANDLVDGEVTVTCNPASGSTFELGDTEVACTATDNHGNTGEGSFNVRVVDTTAPVLILPSTMTEEATSPAGAVVGFPVSSMDNIDGPVDVVCDHGSGDTFPLGTTTVSCSATDNAGNTATGSFDIEVVDTTAPTISLNGDAELSVEVYSVYSDAGASASDIVDGDLTLDIAVVNSVDTSALGDYTVTYDVTDNAGNAADQAVRTVHVVDTTAPVITVPADITAEATSSAGASVEFDAGASDNYDDVILVCDYNSGDTFALGTTTVTCSATDNSGNTGTDSFDITVQDTTAPTVTVSEDITGVEATSSSGASVTFETGASDIVDGAVAVSCDYNSEGMFALGTTTVTCSATDNAGNTGTNSFDITVVDTTSPVITVLGDNPVSVEVGSSYVDAGATASDVVDGDLSGSINVESNVDVDNIGIYTVSYSVSDDAGNSASATRTVNVIDSVKPVITLTNPSNGKAFNEELLLTRVNIGVPLSFIVTDVSPIGQCTWTLNSVDENSQLEVAKDVEQTYYFAGRAGKYYWNVSCTDAGENTNVSETRTFTILSSMDNFEEGTEYTDLTGVDNISGVMYFYISTDQGIINWTGPLDLSSGKDWSQCVKIEGNNVSVDSVTCPKLNSPARITLYNLNWTDPRILKNGEVCSFPSCSEVSYDSENGTLVFDVSGFSSYSSDETPVSSSSADSSEESSGSGGGSSCNSDWNCVAWSACVDGTQTRTCKLSKTNCFHPAKPSESQSCTISAPEAPTEPTTETTVGEDAGGAAGITGAVIGALGGGWFVAAVFIAGVFGVAVFLRLRARA